MRYFKLIILFCIAGMLACNSNTELLDVKPVDLISKEEMIDVLIDMHITESALSLKNLNRDSSLKHFVFYKEDIYKEHNITEKQFKESYDYYAKHSEEFNRIYEVVIDSLGVKEAMGTY